MEGDGKVLVIQKCSNRHHLLESNDGKVNLIGEAQKTRGQIFYFY